MADHPSSRATVGLNQDLVNIIVTFVPSLITVRICSLVHPVWVQPCQKRLFYRITISQDFSARKLSQVLTKSPFLGTYARELKLDYGLVRETWLNENKPSTITQILLHTPQLNSILFRKISDIVLFQQIGECWRISSSGSKIAKLGLEHCVFKNVCMLIQFISTLPNVRHLELDYVPFVEEFSGPDLLSNIQLPLRSLSLARITGDFTSMDAGLLLSHLAPGTLTSLSIVRTLPLEELNFLYQFMSSSTDWRTLTHLRLAVNNEIISKFQREDHIHYCLLSLPAHMPHFTSLEWLEINIYKNSQFSLFVDTIDAVTSPLMRRLTLHHYLIYPNPAIEKNLEWDRLTDAVERMLGPSGLFEVYIVKGPGPRFRAYIGLQELYVATANAGLSRLVARGIARVQGVP
jgi:hypothetical protein